MFTKTMARYYALNLLTQNLKKEFHGNNYFTTKISIIARCFGEPKTSMITEAVHINQLSNEDTLNSKSEWTYIKLPSATIR